MFWKILTRIGNWRRGGAANEAPSLEILLAVWYTAASFLLVALVAGALYLGLALNLKKLSEQILGDELDVCRALVRARATDSHALREEVEIDSAIRRYQKFYIRVRDDAGRALFTTPGMDRELVSDAILRQAADQQAGHVFWLKGASGKPYRAVVIEVRRDAAGTGPWQIQLTMDLSQEAEVLSDHRMWVWAVLALAAILCPRMGIAAARWGTGPLREVGETARHISSSNLSERIQVQRYPLEIAKLANSFNEMLQRLEDSFVRLSRFSADIAHELRTPVNNIRGEAEVVLAKSRTAEEYRESLGSCLEESVRLSELIESLLFLARAESPGEHLKKRPQDIGTLLSTVRDYYEASAAELGVGLRLECEKDLIAEVDEALLQRALGNLVSNALAHTSSGGNVSLNARHEGTQLHIKVQDTGSGISQDALPKIFDRFYRTDQSRTRNLGGTGLGLSIVNQIVFLHGGEVKIQSEVGTGTTVSVVLPGRRTVTQSQ